MTSRSMSEQNSICESEITNFPKRSPTFQSQLLGRSSRHWNVELRLPQGGGDGETGGADGGEVADYGGPDHRWDKERAMAFAYFRSLKANSFVSVRT